MSKKLMSAILLGVSCLGLTGCEDVEATLFTIDKKDDVSKLSLKEELILDHYNGGKYSVKFKNIKKTSKRNEYASSEINDVVIINYEFENYSVDENILLYEGIDFKIFDKNNNQLSSYPLQQSLKYATPTYIGGVSSASIAVGSEEVLDSLYIVIYNQEKPVGYIQHNFTN